jgi:hypothetical protein
MPSSHLRHHFYLFNRCVDKWRGGLFGTKPDKRTCRIELLCGTYEVLFSSQVQLQT